MLKIFDFKVPDRYVIYHAELVDNEYKTSWHNDDGTNGSWNCPKEEGDTYLKDKFWMPIVINKNRRIEVQNE